MAGRLWRDLAWLLGLLGLWLLFVASTSPAEVLLGLGSALVAVALGMVVRRFVGPQPLPRLRWLWQLSAIVPRFGVETGQVFWALFLHLLRRRTALGAFRAVAYGGIQPDELTAAAADAVLIAANSFTPNTIVLDVDRVEGLVLLHQLVPQAHEAASHSLIRPR